MKSLYQILQLLPKQKLTLFFHEKADLVAEEESLILRLFELLNEEDRQYNDDEAASILYGPKYNASHAPFQKLKHKVKYRLLNLVVVMDDLQPDFSSPKAAAKSLYRELAIAQTLALEKHSSAMAVELFRKVHKNALRYQFLPILEQASEKLAVMYGGIQKNPKERKRFKELRKQYREINDVKYRLSDLYSDVLEDYRVKPAEEIVAKMQDNLEYVNEALRLYDINDIQFIGFGYLQSFYQLKGDNDLVIKTCKRALTKLESLEGVNRDQVNFFKGGIITALVQSDRKAEAIEVIETTLSKMKEGEANYYKYLEYSILLSIELFDYQHAIENYQSINQSSLSRSTSKRNYQQWMLLEAYLKFIAEFILPPNDCFRSKLRFSKLRNDTHLLTDEKEVLNLHVYILEYCTALCRKKYNVVIDRTEAFQKYVQRYVKARNNPRAHFFCKTLLQILKADFHAVRTANHAKAYLTKLVKSERKANSYVTFSEVIPFEVLIHTVFKQLKGFEYLEREGLKFFN